MRTGMTDPSRTGDGDGRARRRTVPGRRYQVSRRTNRDCNARVMAARGTAGHRPREARRPGSEDVVPEVGEHAIEAERVALRTIDPEAPGGSRGRSRDRVEEQPAAAARAHHAV